MIPSPSSRKTLSVKALYVLDEDFYPDEWRDDKLMSEMMYNFRPKQVNPQQYNFKMTFWKEMIEQYCEYKGTSTFTIAELKEVFKRKGTSPYCLNDVVNQMISDQNVQDKNSFMSSPQTWSQWTFGVISTPISWSFNKLRERVWGSSEPDTVFVSKNVLKHQARILQNHVQNAHSYNNIISMDELMQSSDDIDGLSRDGILMTLQYLSTVEKSVYIEENKESEHHQKILMKFSQPQQIAMPITQLERSLYNLETTEKFLISAIDKKENYLNDVLNNIKVCLKDGKKQMAKTHLRKKHMLENDLTKTMSILENIQAMLQRIHQSKSDKEILHTYKHGVEGIKHIFTDSGINIDNVYDVIEDMKDVLGDQDELQNIISTPLRGNYEDIDDAELEAELKELVDSEKVVAKPEEPKSDLNLIDLEIRLKRLRGELPELSVDDGIPTAPKFYKSPSTQMSQH